MNGEAIKQDILEIIKSNDEATVPVRCEKCYHGEKADEIGLRIKCKLSGLKYPYNGYCSWGFAEDGNKENV